MFHLVGQGESTTTLLSPRDKSSDAQKDKAAIAIDKTFEVISRPSQHFVGYNHSPVFCSPRVWVLLLFILCFLPLLAPCNLAHR